MTPTPVLESILLEFVQSDDGSILLDSWTLSVDEDVIVAKATGERQFKWWRRGPQVLALALVRLARWRETSKTSRPVVVPLLAGRERPSLAAALGDVVMKAHAVSWVADMLSVNPSLASTEAKAEAVSRLRRWLAFGNVQGKRSVDGVTVGAVLAELPPEAVTIHFDGETISGSALDKLERRLAGMLDGSLPPLPNAPGLKLEGYLPCAGPECLGREALMGSMDNVYATAASRVLVLLGQGGSGKTTVVREWLARRCMANSLEHGLVFSWSFYRQGYRTNGGQMLAEFWARLGEAVGVTLNDGMLPEETATTLLVALCEHPALLFLDGLEVLQSPTSKLPMGITDAALAELLRGLVMQPGSWVLVTSRRPLREDYDLSWPEVQHIKLGPLGLEQRRGVMGRRPLTALEWSLGQRQSAESLQKLLSVLEQDMETDLLPLMVRSALEDLDSDKERALLLAASFFDRPPEWSALLYLLSSSPPIPKLSEACIGLSDELWEEVLFSLQGRRLLQFDADNRVSIHPRVIECLANDVRLALPVAWVEGHRRLSDYFAEQPEDYLPETLLGMEPLMRACWHSCQAGDYRHAYQDIIFPRVSRGNAGHVFFELGAYQEGLNVAKLFYTPEGYSFPMGCDLGPDDRVMMIHVSALCLRYLDRLEEAYEVQKMAWERTWTKGCSITSIGPTAVHMLRLQHIFGDLHSSGPVLRRLAMVLTGSASTAEALRVPPSLLATALGYIGSTVATCLWYKGHRWSARAVLRIAERRVNRLSGREVHLAPGIGCPTHALILLDMGEWRQVEQGLAQCDAGPVAKRNRETGSMFLVRGRMLSQKAKSLSGKERENVATEALDVLDCGLALAERNRFRWWQSAFHLALARHHAEFGERVMAIKSAQHCAELAKTNGFKLLEIEAVQLLSTLNASSPSNGGLQKNVTVATEEGCLENAL